MAAGESETLEGGTLDVKIWLGRKAGPAEAHPRASNDKIGNDKIGNAKPGNPKQRKRAA